MSEQNLQTVQEIYEAFGSGDVDTIIGFCADDVDWAPESAAKSAPWHGQYKGKDEVPIFFKEIYAAIEVTEFTPLAFATSDAGDVMVVIRFGYTVPSTGKSSSMELHHHWKLEDGKVVRYRGTEDTAQTAWAFSPN